MKKKWQKNQNRKLKTMLSSEFFGFGNENGVSVSSAKNLEKMIQ
jgi:hypothetical protein